MGKNRQKQRRWQSEKFYHRKSGYFADSPKNVIQSYAYTSDYLLHV